MGADEKNRIEILSRLVADLSVKSTSGNDLTSKINRLRGEIKKVIDHEDTIFGKFRGLVESFREIIPDEKQRYHAAIKAMSATSKLSNREIVQAVNNQVSELKILEKGLKSALPGWRDELKIMDARSRELRDEVSKLREKIVKLESEEKGLRESITTREKEMELVEKAVEKLFTEMSAEISTVKKKVEEYTVEASVPPPPTRSSPSKSTIAAKGKGALTKKSEDAKPEPEPEQEESGWQKKCPMCGGRMDLFSQDNMWRCYSCGNEEADNGRSSAQESVSTPTEPEEDTEWKKKCPMCGGKMNYYSQENLWQCYTCAYEEGEKSGGTDSSAKRNSPGPYAVPLGDISFDAFGETETKSPSYSKQSATKKKPCPACRKKMSWYPDEQAWRCPYCHYERRI